MHLDELRIDDFGCFRNARLDAIADGLVVLGGPQRAGKTTFMHAIRQFPTGVSRGDDLPPPTDEYRIDAEITHEGNRYRYALSGFAEPAVSPIGDGPEIDAGDIFGPVTDRQYRNLYTISLDELRRLPPGIADSEDLARVLLGGAYGDIADIPEVRELFRKRAHDIGLKRGNPEAKTTELHDPYTTIRDGIEARKEASTQVEDHRSVTRELEEKRSEQAEVQAEIDEHRRERDRLNVLDEVFEPLQQIDTLDARLSATDLDAIDEFPTHLAGRLDHFEEQFVSASTELGEAEQDFAENATVDTGEAYAEWLLEYQTDLERFTDDQKVWEKKAEQLTARREELANRRAELEAEISSLSADWDESFEPIDAVETNRVDTAHVATLASELEDLRDERDAVERELETNTRQAASLEADLAEMDAEEAGTREVTIPRRKPAVGAAIAIATGSAVGYFVTPILGGIVGLLVLGVGLYAIDSTVTVDQTAEMDPIRELNGQLATLESQIDADSDRLADLEAEIADAEERLDDLVTDLGLPAELPAGEIPQFYERVVELAEEIDAYRRDRSAWEKETEEFAEELAPVATLLAETTERSWTTDEPLDGAETLLSTLERVAADLALAREVRSAADGRKEAIEDIASVLEEWDTVKSVDSDTADEQILRNIQEFQDEAERVADLEAAVDERDQLRTQVTSRLDSPSAQQAFDPLRPDDQPVMQVVRDRVADYADTDAIADDIREQQERISHLEDRRRELQKACIELENRRDELASEDDLQAAQATIDDGRVEFERVGEAYAVDRIAEDMVGRLHDGLMADVVHSLVDDASDIFSEITREYDGIELEGDLQDLEFRALRGEKSPHGVGELSRATGEQLFLAVRLARIRQTDVDLPVVVDDATTNFDPHHMSRVFSVVDELTATNQVFFLTCHPEVVRIAASKGRSPQYWSVDTGQFAPQETAAALEERLTIPD